MGGSVLQYRPLNDDGSVIDVERTFVPPEDRGKQTAEKLCAAAFEHARETHQKIVPSCSYVRDRFVPKHSDLFDDVALTSFDAHTPGLQICTSRLGVARLALTDSRRRNPLTLPILRRLRTFLQECVAMEVSHEGCAPPVRAVVIESTG